MALSPPASPTKPQVDGPRSRRQRDPEELEDEEMSRNPREWPFPTFQPSEAAAARKKREATKAITEMSQGLKPVVPFSRPELVYARPPWNTSTVVKRRYEPQLDLLTPKPTPRKPTPPLEQPKWVTYIPRAVSGCPQLGLVMVNEPDASTRTPKRLRRHRRIVPEDPDPLEEASRPQRIDDLARSVGRTPRYAQHSKDDLTVDLLRDERVRHVIQKEVAASGHAATSRNVLVSLPKIGVRLFTLRSSVSFPADEMASSRSARLPALTSSR